MNIIIGHTNMDLDCIASMVIAGKLFPNYKPVKSRLIHPVAKNLYNIMKKNIDMLELKDVENESIENIIVVDTRSNQRIKEFKSIIDKVESEIIIYDHHPSDSDDIINAVLNYKDCGSNATFLGSIAIDEDIDFTPEEATIALTGIYADTGSFSHENTTELDFYVAGFFAGKGASIDVVRYFLKNLQEDYQVNIFHELLNRLIYRNINNQDIILSYMELDDQLQGLAAVIENIFEIENHEAYFAVFHLKKKKDTIIIARSKNESVDVKTILSLFNGGGHKMAASAIIKKSEGSSIYNQLISFLEENICAPKKASDLMSESVHILDENISLKEASIKLEYINCTGAPVVNGNGNLTGFLTLRDIMKGRKANQMHAPVKAYMAKNIITVGTDTSIKEIYKMLYRNNIGHLPVIKDNTIKGIITRTDIVNHMYMNHYKN